MRCTMDQKLLTFLTLCRTMNYRRAADALHLTQPAVTKQIQSLESQYGVKLFSYDERKLRKTAQGEILERYAMELQYNDAELARLLAAKPKTLLRIGATKSIGDYILIPRNPAVSRVPGKRAVFHGRQHRAPSFSFGGRRAGLCRTRGPFRQATVRPFSAARRALYRHLRGG